MFQMAERQRRHFTWQAKQTHWQVHSVGAEVSTLEQLLDRYGVHQYVGVAENSQVQPR